MGGRAGPDYIEALVNQQKERNSWAGVVGSIGPRPVWVSWELVVATSDTEAGQAIRNEALNEKDVCGYLGALSVMPVDEAFMGKFTLLREQGIPKLVLAAGLHDNHLTGIPGLEPAAYIALKTTKFNVARPDLLPDYVELPPVTP